ALAWLRLFAAGRGRVSVADRRARWPALAHGVVHRRPDDRAVCRLRTGVGRAGGPRERQGAGPGRQPVRHGGTEPRLSRDLVSEFGSCAGARAALGPSLAGAEPALPHKRWL